MANPRLPGISENEQALLYAKLNEYNRGRASFKEVGVYLVVLPRPGDVYKRQVQQTMNIIRQSQE